MARSARKGIVPVIISLVLLGAALFYLRPRSGAVSEREEATRILGDYLRVTLQPKAVLVIGNPYARLPNRPAQVYTFENAGVAGLKKSLGAGVSTEAAAPQVNRELLENPAAAPIDPKSPTPLSFLVESAAFEALIKAHPECSVVVSLIGLPVNLHSLEAWTRPGLPHFALLLPDWRIIGDAGAIQGAFASGKLAAAIIERPGAQAGADDRYVLVSSNNVAQLLQRYPQVFTP